MFAICATFRDENGETRTGQLVDTFRIIIEGDEEVIEVDPAIELTIACFNGETIHLHRVPSLALVDLREVVPA